MKRENVAKINNTTEKIGLNEISLLMKMFIKTNMIKDIMTTTESLSKLTDTIKMIIDIINTKLHKPIEIIRWLSKKEKITCII